MTDPLDPTDPTPNDPAKARFMVIQSMRWIGLALVIFGLVIVNRKIDLPQIVGYGLVLVGLVDALIMPTVLSRRWKSPLE
jgi:drug/metabolite transporter (DMT)-like permease